MGGRCTRGSSRRVSEGPGEGCAAVERRAAPRRGGRAPTPGLGAPELRARPPRGRRGNRSPGRSVGTCAPFPQRPGPPRASSRGARRPSEPRSGPSGSPCSRLFSRPPFGTRTRLIERRGGGGGTRARVHLGVRDTSRRRLPRLRPAPLARSAGAFRARPGSAGCRGTWNRGGPGRGPGGGAGRALGAGCRGRIPRGRARAVRMLVLA